MPMAAAIPLITSGIGALAGIFGNKSQTSKTQSTSTETPNLLPGQQDFLSSITGKYNTLLSQDPNMTGYQAQGQQTINQNSALAQKAAENYAASRGISGPAALTPQLMVDNSRIAQSSQFANSIPLLARQQMMQTLGQAGSFAATVPHGSTTTGSVSYTTPSNMVAGGLGNLSSMLAYFAGKNMLPGQSAS